MRRELEIGQGKDNEALSTERDSKRTRPDLNYYASSRPYSAVTIACVLIFSNDSVILLYNCEDFLTSTSGIKENANQLYPVCRLLCFLMSFSLAV